MSRGQINNFFRNPECRNNPFIFDKWLSVKEKPLTSEKQRMSVSEEEALEGDCSTVCVFIPLGVVVVGERGRKALWFLRFSVSDIKAPHTHAVGETDR